MTPASLPHPKGKGWEDRSGGLSPLPPSPAPSSTISLWLREGGPIAPIPVSLSLDPRDRWVVPSLNFNHLKLKSKKEREKIYPLTINLRMTGLLGT